MVNVENHETAADDGIAPIKSTISVDIDNDSDVDYFALCGVYNHEIKTYVAANFKKEITDLDVLNFAMMLCCYVVTAETDDEKAAILKDVNDIVNDKYKLNEYLFTHLAIIKTWIEITAALECKYGNKKNMQREITETEFNELMKANNEKNHYKAWNDERTILNKYSSKFADDGGDDNGES